MSTELPPDLEKFADHLNPLLDVAEQVSGKMSQTILTKK